MTKSLAQAVKAHDPLPANKENTRPRADNGASSRLIDMSELDRLINDACRRIAPLWPLENFVAVNPFFGMTDLSFQAASDTIARITGNSLYMSRDYYREQLESGRISEQDLQQAIVRCGSTLDLHVLHTALTQPAPRPKLGMAQVSEVLERVEGGLWSSFVTERISMHCAAYFDLGQAVLPLPWRNLSLYDAWRETAKIDLSPRMMGLKNFRPQVAALPDDPRAVIALAIQVLGVPDQAVERYLHASLLSVGGWAAWTRYLLMQAELAGQSDQTMINLLAIRLAWDLLLYQNRSTPALIARWQDMLAASMRPPSAKRQAAAEIDRVLLCAMEIGFQRTVLEGLSNTPSSTAKAATRPDVQAAFCIDVRSEVFRRALETVAPTSQTVGFAGFFGIFIEYVPLAAASGRRHVPVIFNPTYCIHETAKHEDSAALITQRRRKISLSKAWKGFKFSASSCFSFVESSGLLYLQKLVTDSLGWSRPVDDPHSQGLSKDVVQRIGPSLNARTVADDCTSPLTHGIPPAERINNAERILRGMSLTGNFARLVVLAGHGSSSVNNPHATGLDCGACAGQTGEASARVVVALMNDPAVRTGLTERGIEIPQDTWFVAALHDTTTDEVALFDTENVPVQFGAELTRLQQWLEQAGDLARMERAALLGLAGLTDKQVEASVLRRSRDWSQIRPEWALANNAAFIAAPRTRTTHIDLAGRAFLHDYDWQQDNEFKILELIMTAPMVVANWINMQYYGSVIDNRHFGSGNKVLHNIVGGAIGVLEGNGGDLRVGLPMQSLHDGKRWIHEPLRLSVYLEAPQAAIDDIIERHSLVRQLVDNQWLHIFQLDGNTVYRRAAAQNWERL